MQRHATRHCLHADDIFSSLTCYNCKSNLLKYDGQTHHVTTYLFLFSPVFICFPLQFVLLGLSCHKPVLFLLLLYQSLLRWRWFHWLLFFADCCLTTKTQHIHVNARCAAPTTNKIRCCPSNFNNTIIYWSLLTMNVF